MERKSYRWLTATLRRGDEALAPPWSRGPSDELVRGGFSAEWSRRQRHAKSARRRSLRG